MDQSKIQLYDNQPIRTAWDEENEEWYFAIVDVVAVLTDSPNPQTYWRVMKKRLKDEGNETVTNCNALKRGHRDGLFCPSLTRLYPHSGSTRFLLIHAETGLLSPAVHSLRL